jgi:type I restriction enzyme S subunit
MRKYQSYKPSGVEWIEDIPSHWEIKKNKFFTTPQKIKSEKGEEELLSVSEKKGIIPRSEIRNDEQVLSRSESLDGYLIVKKGNLVSNIMLMWKRGLGVSEYDGIVSPAYSVFSFNKSFPKYYHYLFRTDQYVSEFKRNSRGVIESRLRLYDEMFGSLHSHFPPLQEQEQIVKYLDEKTSIIDKLISTKERKIELLKEQRTSLINEVTTKGLNPNVKLKDSGVEWIGEIPESWIVGKLKNFCELKISSIDKHIYEYEKQVIVCNYTDVYYNEIITNELELRKGSCSEDEYNKFKLNKGDVIITKDSESPTDIGVPSLINDDLDNVVCGYHLSIIKPLKNKLVGGFLFRQLQTKRIRSYFEVCSNGITRFGLGKSSVLDTLLIIPSVKEQQEIVEYLDKHTKEIDDLVSMEQKKIELLKEYRQSLISEVITGKIKVVE